MVFGPFYGGDGRLPGVRELSEEYGVATHVHERDAEWIVPQSAEEKDVVRVRNGQLLPVGPAVLLELIHTPGHSAGSMSTCVRERGGGGGELASAADGVGGCPSTAGTKPVALMTGEFVRFRRESSQTSYIAQLVDVVQFELLSRAERTFWAGCEGEMMVRIRWASLVGEDGVPCAAASPLKRPRSCPSLPKSVLPTYALMGWSLPETFGILLPSMLVHAIVWNAIHPPMHGAQAN